MNKQQILEEITDIFKDVLDDDSIVLNFETNSDNVDDWDSLGHIQLIVAIEKKFSIKFTIIEMTTWKHVGDMIDTILKRI